MRAISLALVAGSLIVCACAAGNEGVKPTPPWAIGKEVREGRVFSLSDERLSLFDPRRPNADGVVLRVDPATAFVAGDEPISRADLEEGTPVRVYFAPGDQPVATRVEVMGGS